MNLSSIPGRAKAIIIAGGLLLLLIGAILYAPANSHAGALSPAAKKGVSVSGDTATATARTPRKASPCPAGEYDVYGANGGCYATPHPKVGVNPVSCPKGKVPDGGGCFPANTVSKKNGGTQTTQKAAPTSGSCQAGWAIARGERLCCPKAEPYAIRAKCLTYAEHEAGDVPPYEGRCPVGTVDAEELCRTIEQQGVDAEGCPYYDFTDGTQAIDCLDR